MCVWNTYTKKKRLHFLSCGLWDPPLHYLNRNHVLLLSPLSFVLKIPREETEDVLRALLAPWPVTWNWLHVLLWPQKHNSELAFLWLWCCWLGCDDGSRYLRCAHSGFSLQCYWFISQFTKKKKKIINYAQSKLCEAGRCWMELVVPSWSDLCFRLCKLHSLEQLNFLSRGCIWPRCNTAEKLCFSCYFNHNNYWCRYLLPTKPSWFILGHLELRFIMFSVVGILLCYKNKWKNVLP